MTIEEKAKAYDEALERARVAYKDEDKHLKATLERIFPELKESEDERISKEIFHFVLENTLSTDMRQHRWLAWLEKQSEKKEINPTLQEKERMDDAFTKMMLKLQVDDFNAELNSLLKKYEHLPKVEILGCLNFYVLVLGKATEEQQ